MKAGAERVEAGAELFFGAAMMSSFVKVDSDSNTFAAHAQDTRARYLDYISRTRVRVVGFLSDGEQHEETADVAQKFEANLYKRRE